MFYTLHAVAAIVLLVGFYTMAIGIAGGMLYLVYFTFTAESPIPPWIMGPCLGAALLILYSILPRPDRFQAPGPRLQEADQPELFRTLKSVAESAGQAMPADVYLVMDVNASVSQRGGWLGFGSRRVMELGLPLMQGLSRDEIRAVIAHEFGHFYGGDTSLYPVIYRTRAALGRTIEELDNSLTKIPFEWYGTLFLRITQAISRRQEYAADALAARLVGASSLISGLQKLPGLTQGFHAYFQTDAANILNAGYLPPLTPGFSSFMNHPSIATEVQSIQEAALGESAGDPYDAHPPLPDRIAALKAIPEEERSGDDHPAISILTDVADLERRLLGHLFGEDHVSELKPIAWEDVGEQVVLPAYEEVVNAQPAALAGITFSNYPELARKRGQMAKKVVIPGDQNPTTAQRRAYAFFLLGAALVLELHRRGWTIKAGPGGSITLESGAEVIDPFLMVESLRNGELSAAQWDEFLASAGLEGVVIGSPA